MKEKNEKAIVSHPTLRNLLSTVLVKTFFEFIAIGTGIGGIIYTLQEDATRALIMDTLSALSAILAFIVGMRKLRFLRQHNLLKRATILVAIGALISITIIVWHFKFHI